LRFERRSGLRYGENPHQKAAFYAEPGLKHACVASAETLHGKELSYNNLLDLDSALNLVREFTAPAAVVIKHNNPCGAAAARTPARRRRRSISAASTAASSCKPATRRRTISPTPRSSPSAPPAKRKWRTSNSPGSSPSTSRATRLSWRKRGW